LVVAIFTTLGVSTRSELAAGAGRRAVELDVTQVSAP
jgi:hypothetical protein